MALKAFIAAPRLGIVDAEGFSTAGDVGLGEGGVGCDEADTEVGACLGSLAEGFYERVAAVGVDGVVAAAVGHHHVAQPSALGHADGNRQHDAVAKGYDGGVHVGVLVVSFGNGVGAAE